MEPQVESVLAIPTEQCKNPSRVGGMWVGQWTSSKESEDSGKRSAESLARALHPEGWAADPGRFAKAAARRPKENHTRGYEHKRVALENCREMPHNFAGVELFLG